MQEEQDVSAFAMKDIQKRKAKEGSLKTVNDADAREAYIASKIQNNTDPNQSAQDIAKRVRDEDAALAYYNKIVNS